jgi:prepilin peptidase CpaA
MEWRPLCVQIDSSRRPYPGKIIMSQVAAVPVAIVLLASVIASITDLWKFKIYNLLTVPLLIAGLAYHSIMLGWAGFNASLCGMLLGFAVFIIPYLAGIMGSGDVKLVAAVGAWLGVSATSVVVLLGCALTVVYALAFMMFKGGIGALWDNLVLSSYRVSAVIRHMAPDDEYETVQMIAGGQRQRGRLIPFSVMLGAGFIIALIFLREL